MYDFHYGYIKKNYGKKAQLLFTDTDSLCYQIETEDIYKDFFRDKHLFDLSDVEGEFNDNTNKKVLGKMKMEYPNDTIVEFIGLRSKMYSLKLKSEKEDKKAKGIVKSVINKNLHHEMYKETLDKSQQIRSSMNVIRSMKHQIYTLTINKISLSPYDDKRYLRKNGIRSYSHGHYKTYQ